MSETRASRSPRRWFVTCVVVALLGLLLTFLSLTGRPARHAADVVAPEPGVPEVVVRAAKGREAPGTLASPPHPDLTPPGIPIIDEVKVEKQEVCEGEENLVTVRAHTPAGRDDAFLHYFIGTSPGQAVPVRAYLPPAGGEVPGPMQVQVFGRDNVVTAVALPTYKIKRCRPERALYLRSRQMPNSVDEFEIEADVRALGPSPAWPVKGYRWSFGDHQSQVTVGPAAVHRYVPPNPDALYSEFLVTCEALGNDGRTVLGRTALSLRNTEFENLRFANTLMLSVELTPRFPQVDSRGQVVQVVRLYHHRSAPVRLDRARISYVGADEKDTRPAQTVTAIDLLGTEEVPPGHGVERPFYLDTKQHSDTVMVDYEFEGRTADGVRAVARFSVMRPPALPTADNGERVVDPLLARKILRARERLGKPFVNDEDLRQLEREGVFADLKEAASEAPAEEPSTPVSDLSPSVKAGIASKSRGRL